MESYWAKIENGIVTSVEVVSDDFVAANPQRYSGTWKKVGTPEQPFVGKGYTKIDSIDKIVEPKPYDSWVLDEVKLEWKSTKEKPGADYYWNENTKEWVKISKP